MIDGLRSCLLNLADGCNFQSLMQHYYPARACASKGLCDRSWCLLYIVIYISAKLFFYLSKYSLSDAHFNTGRLLFEFNRLLYTLAAPEVFVSSANPVSLPSGYRVSIVRNTNIDQIETTPLRYMLGYAYLARYRQHSRIDLSVYRSTSEEKHAWETAEERQWSVSHL